MVLWWGEGWSLFLSWSGVGRGCGVRLLFLGFSMASKILFGFMLDSSVRWLLIEYSL